MNSVRLTLGQAAPSASGPVVIDVKGTRKSITHGYENWRRVGVPEVSSSPTVAAARRELDDHLGSVKQY